MVEQGARRLILMSRTALPLRSSWSGVDPDHPLTSTVEVVRQLECLGASVRLASVDVSDEDQLRGFLDTYSQEMWPPIGGVIHAAGVASLQTVAEMNLDSLLAVMRSKILGGWLLHALLKVNKSYRGAPTCASLKESPSKDNLIAVLQMPASRERTAHSPPVMKRSSSASHYFLESSHFKM